eukprot:13649439-Ditylum_brightwellii.AAC.1
MLSLLNLYSNLITGPIPAEIGMMSNISKIVFSSNSLTGTIPSGMLSKLRALRLDDNRLSKSMLHVGNATSSLQYLNISNN